MDQHTKSTHEYSGYDQLTHHDQDHSFRVFDDGRQGISSCHDSAP